MLFICYAIRQISDSLIYPDQHLPLFRPLSNHIAIVMFTKLIHTGVAIAPVTYTFLKLALRSLRKRYFKTEEDESEKKKNIKKYQVDTTLLRVFIAYLLPKL
jgi:hypothetical protein